MYSFFLMARRAGVPKSRCLSRLDYGSQRLRGGTATVLWRDDAPTTDEPGLGTQRAIW